MKRACLIQAALGCLLSLHESLVVAQPSAAWIDPSPHSTAFVRVEDGVELEVLDWGGTGRPILLLAGLGDTAHVFDDFAPVLIDRHHVYALTRRGFGNSSAPEQGYDFDRLAADVISVIEALELEQPIVVGHSFAGEEMHIVGSRHASLIAGLVYIDAAFNRADESASYDAKLRELPRAPRPDAGDLVSTATLREFRARNALPQYPEAEVRGRFVVDSSGVISGQRNPAPAVQQGVLSAMAAVSERNPEPLRVPALAIYAVPNAAEDLLRPWHDRNHAAVQQTIREVLVLARERYTRHAEWFQSFAGESSRATRIAGDHYLFVTDPANVKEDIETFASSLAGRR